ncbi:MAG: PP2C family protein-serine/threonine phosphatase [Acidobacteriota bacterium]
MTLRAVIVDDEPPARARLRQLLTEAGGVAVVGEAADAVEARATIVALRPDVVFLDIEMPQVSGTSLAASLPEPRPFVVFATAFDHYALDAFAVDATDYLVKPVTRARLAGTLARVRERLSRRSDLERDLAVASATQAHLLPQSLPAIDGYEAAAMTAAAKGVGGDFFVGERVSPTRVVLALGDVSGKGMPAGLVASSLQARLETAARHGAAGAGELVADVNRALHATTDGARYATLAYVELDPAHHRVTLVNAGHPPAFIVHPDHPPVSLPSTAPALGLLPEAKFVEQETLLDAGGTLVMYSDGVTEALSPDGDEFGESRLLDVVFANAPTSAGALCAAVLHAVRTHAGGLAAFDDVTVLALRRLASVGASR